jgi:uncharacterized protein
MSSEVANHHVIDDEAGLRACYPQPLERARLKQLAGLDHHMRNFIALSPILFLGTSSDAGGDVTPRGDAPGFVHVVDDTTLLIPDWPGNNRLDALTNIVANRQVGILMMIPGMDETLRVNGIAEITTDPDVLARWNVNGKQPRSALRVTVREAYLHCAKALIRSKLWKDDYKVDRGQLPPYGQMLKEQARLPQTGEEVQAMVEESYRDKLY